MNSIIINGNNFYVNKSNDQLIVFINCQFTSKIFIKLQELSHEIELFIFVKKTNKYTKQAIKHEREAIIIDHQSALLDNYYRYQLEQLPTNDNLTKPVLVTNRSELETIVNSSDLLEVPIEKKFVTEYKINCNQQLIDYIDLLFRNVNADKIAITSDLVKVNTTSPVLTQDDKLIARSSNNVDDQVFYISDQMLESTNPKLVLLSEADYKYAIDNLLTTDYIVDFKDNLRFSKYFNQVCNQYGVQTTNQYINDANLITNTVTVDAIIDIVENSQTIEIYQIVDNRCILLNKLNVYDRAYQLLKLERNHCLKVNIQWTIEQSVLKQQ